VKRHLMIVLSNSKPERDDEFNRWYDQHAADVVDKLDGFVRAQRFELSEAQAEGGAEFGYLAVYEIPADQLEAARDAIVGQRAEREEALSAGREPLITVTDTMAGPHHTWFFSSVSDEIVPESK
jgi:hypothetical protein